MQETSKDAPTCFDFSVLFFFFWSLISFAWDQDNWVWGQNLKCLSNFLFWFVFQVEATGRVEKSCRNNRRDYEPKTLWDSKFYFYYFSIDQIFIKLFKNPLCGRFTENDQHCHKLHKKISVIKFISPDLGRKLYTCHSLPTCISLRVVVSAISVPQINFKSPQFISHWDLDVEGFIKGPFPNQMCHSSPSDFLKKTQESNRQSRSFEAPHSAVQLVCLSQGKETRPGLFH